MTKDKFQELCERVLIPRIGDVVYRQVSEVNETLESFAREIARIGQRLDRILAQLDRHDGERR